MPKREERMLRSMLPCAGQPPAETDPAPDVSSAEVAASWSGGWVSHEGMCQSAQSSAPEIRVRDRQGKFRPGCAGALLAFGGTSLPSSMVHDGTLIVGFSRGGRILTKDPGKCCSQVSVFWQVLVTSA